MGSGKATDSGSFMELAELLREVENGKLSKNELVTLLVLREISKEKFFFRLGGSAGLCARLHSSRADVKKFLEQLESKKFLVITRTIEENVQAFSFSFPSSPPVRQVNYY
jgi:hypothetical protein